jgi:hypothetical protein
MVQGPQRANRASLRPRLPSVPEPLPYDVEPRRFRWEVPDGLDSEVLPIAREIVRLGRRYEYWGDRQDYWRMTWEALNFALGIAAAVLAGVAGVMALDSGSTRAIGILALTSAVLGTILSTLNPNRRALNSAEKARTCWNVVTRVRFFVAADLLSADAAAARQLLIEVQGLETKALDSLSPMP